MNNNNNNNNNNDNNNNNNNNNNDSDFVQNFFTSSKIQKYLVNQIKVWQSWHKLQ